MDSQNHYGLDIATFARIIDNLHDEIIVYDNNYRIVYINKACQRHYGLRPQEMIGQSFWHFVKENKYWNRSVLPSVYKLKRPLKQEQETFTGAKIFTLATPLFDEDGKIEYVAMNVRDEEHEGQISRMTDLLDKEENPPERVHDGLIYCGEPMQKIMHLADQVSQLPSPCLLLGETGCGKSLLAQYIHANSPRANNPFVVINCASIPGDLFESELFGHVRGAFTGAGEKKEGLFCLADGGTIFLDEISELPLALQPKILHAVQDMEIRAIGTTKVRKVDVKIISATNRNLVSMVKSGAFRQDLFYRLNVFEITLPPLRKRPKDLLPLIYNFINYYSERYQKRKSISEGALAVMRQYQWRGNVRELSHIIERLMVTVDSETIRSEDLPGILYETDIEGEGSSSLSPVNSLDASLENLEEKIILRAFKDLGSSRKVSKSLNISQSRASRLIRKYRK